MTREEAQNAPDIVLGTFPVNTVPATDLFDSGTSHSFVSKSFVLQHCRGIVTVDVLELGLSRGAIATRKLEGVMWDKEHEGLYWFGPLR